VQYCFLFFSYLRDRTHADITPYAVHVSVRRRSENAALAFNVPPIENPYDEPASEERENEYLRPIRESPYYEIDNDAAGHVVNHECDVYNGADSIGFREENRTFRTFQANCALFSSSENVYNNCSDNVYYNSEAMLKRDVPTCSQSLDNLTYKNDSVNVSYGEIIGTLSKDGSLERFELSKDTYKSVRKNRPKWQ